MTAPLGCRAFPLILIGDADLSKVDPLLRKQTFAAAVSFVAEASKHQASSVDFR